MACGTNLHIAVERWLKASVELKNGEIETRTKGTPQRGVISPLLAHLFLHYAFDYWMQRNYPSNPFERYADDALVHCNTEAEAKKLKIEIAKRMEQCGLELHSEKTKIVTVRTLIAQKRTTAIALTFWGFVSDLGYHVISMDAILLTSHQRFLRNRRKQFIQR